MGLDSRRPLLPAPSESLIADDLATGLSRGTGHTYSIPDDGTPVTISTKKIKKSPSTTSLLIEYFEGGMPSDKVHSRPSVRVRVTPSSARKPGNGNHAQILEASSKQKPSYTRRISLAKRREEKMPEGTEVSDLEESNLFGHIEVEGDDVNILYEPLEVIKRECGWQRDHCVFNDASEAPLTCVRSLGHGSLGVVEEVSAGSQNKSTFVRKRVQMRYVNRAQRLQTVKQEAATMTKLTHPHIIKIIGTYQEDGPRSQLFYSLLMYPVGDNDLKTFLEILGEQQISQNEPSYDAPLGERREWLWTWFGCLAGALTYIHRSGVRHQDIKPSNIVHRGRNIFFTDFGSSSEFQVDHTTSTDNPASTTAMYRAPEVSQFGARHGLGTDIFSLGCVFLEMLAVLCETTVANLHEICCPNLAATRGGYAVRDSLDRIREWFSYYEAYREIYKSIERMLDQEREKRPSAPEVLRFMLELTSVKRVKTICLCHIAGKHNLVIDNNF